LNTDFTKIIIEMKNTLVLGASLKSERYSNRAIRALRKKGYTVFAIGLKEGTVDDVKINTGRPGFAEVDSVTLYLSPKNQKEFYDYIFSLKPVRIIYNPGAENEELEKLAKERGIENLEACTLVLLSTGQY
jgi:uncharacterized protein